MSSPTLIFELKSNIRLLLIMSYAKWVNISHYFKRVLQKYWIHKGTKISAHNSQLPAQDEVHPRRS